MNFYIRQSFDSPIEGPFSTETIVASIASGEITLDWLANPDLRESRSEIERSPKRDWVPIRSIHELSSRWVTPAGPHVAVHESETDTALGCYRIAAIIFVAIVVLLGIAFAVIYAGCHGRIN